ncbi:MAG: serine hydrolase domain-containing protein [Terricaulis sp.]
MKRLILAALLAFATSVAQAQTSEQTLTEFEGLWVSENAFGPALRGDLTITRTGDSWRANIGDAEVSSSTLDFSFSEGRFHGALSRQGILGWWTQPPGLPGQAYATPVRLDHIRAGVWRGAASPLPQTFTLHLRIFHDEEGDWAGAFRNREFNMNGGASRFLATRTGDTLSFSTPSDDRAREAAVVDARRLRLSWPPLPAPIEFVRATPQQELDFRPRPPGQYRYQRPAGAADGWRTAPARGVGFDEAALAALVQSIASADPTARRPQLIHSLLVARHGRLVLEEYFHGYDRQTPHDIRSAGKTFASALLGAAMRGGVGVGPETRIYELMASQGPFVNPDPRKADMTLAHLMSHTSGLDCNDYDDASLGSEGAMQSQVEQPDWWRFALDLPMRHAPGERYAYCTAGTNLVGAALYAATGESVPALFERLIARPLQFGRYHWNLMPNGEGYLGGGAYLRPLDLLKLGQAYLNGGVWNGKRIVDRDWVRVSTSSHVEINEATTGMDADTFANVAIRGADGYGWHRYGVRVGGRMLEAYEANGNGGQFLIVVPEYDLVVVITGGNYGQGGIWNRWREGIVGQGVIAAIRD